jgi:uncharacterized protein YneF (UPF0154 family)
MNENILILSVGIPLITLGGIGCYYYGKKNMENKIKKPNPKLNINENPYYKIENV